MKHYWLFVIAVIGIVFLMAWQPRSEWSLQNILRNGFWGSESAGNDQGRECETLRAECAILKDVKERFVSHPLSALDAIVYSRYLFNLKSELLINKGESSGVLVGQAVVLRTPPPEALPNELAGGILIGNVTKVFEDYAVVQTLYDPEWQSAVRIGEKGVDAILTGGSEPKLTLIPKDAKVSQGDIVYNASQDFPYGIAIGEIGDTALSANGLFHESRVTLLYDIGSVHGVSLLNYVPPPRP